jgi:gliding motility-associated-like protein
MLFGFSLSGQSDCRDFLVVCGNADLSLNSNGTGTDDFANANNQPPDCGFSESQSLWLKVPIARDGLLQFTISANNNQDDFDFAIYGPNVSCNNLGASIRCSSTNPQSAGVPADTGLRITETENSEGPGGNGNGFVSALPVRAGEEYIILIDNFSQTNAGFTLDWGSNAPLIEVPSIDVADVEVCDPSGTGLVPIDLSTLDDQIADGQTGVTVSYHNNEDDALLGENALNKRNFITSNNNQVLYARVTEDGSGCSSIGDFAIVINPDPVLDEIVGSQSICPTVGAVVYEGSGMGVDIYEWIVEGGVVTSGQGTSDILVNWGGPNDEAMIKLVGKTNLGCISDTLFLPVKVNLELDPVLPQGDTEICYLDRLSVRYSVPQVTGSVYTWEVENGSVVGANGGNEVEVRWDDGATTGRVSYREYNPLITDCEGFSDTLGVQLLDEVLVEVTQVNPACNGETNGSIALGITGASGATSVVWADGVTGLVRNSLGDGDYAYTVTDETGCQLQGMITLNEPDLLTITLEEAVSASCFESTDGGLVVSIAGGTESYRYQVNGESGVVTGNMLEVLNLGRGAYELIVRDENDCEARLGFSVTAPDVLEPDLESLQVRLACPGQADGGASVNALGGTPDYSFLWMPVNEAGEQAANLAEGDYTVFITDANGCQTSLDVYVGELVPRVDVPNAFSPNADGVNDTFAPVTNCQLTDYRLQIFNRWGNIIFFTDDQDASWNGEVKNQPAPVGRYSYRLTFRVLVNNEVIEETYQGTLRVIR